MRSPFALLTVALTVSLIIMMGGCSPRPEPDEEVSSERLDNTLYSNFNDPLLKRFAGDNARVAAAANEVTATDVVQASGQASDGQPAAGGEGFGLAQLASFSGQEREAAVAERAAAVDDGDYVASFKTRMADEAERQKLIQSAQDQESKAVFLEILAAAPAFKAAFDEMAAQYPDLLQIVEQ